MLLLAILSQFADDQLTFNRNKRTKLDSTCREEERWEQNSTQLVEKKRGFFENNKYQVCMKGFIRDENLYT